ncbi:MAG: hypothetical protein WD533_07510 [Dehalococcoidia bacterium]
MKRITYRPIPLLAAPTLLFLALLVLAVQPPPAQALSCAGMPIEEYVEWADAVMVGAIESIHEPVSDNRPEADVRVERYLKGAGPDLVPVRSGSPMIAGELVWGEGDIGRKYLFFVREEGAHYETNLCRGTAALDQAGGQTRLAEAQAVTGPGVSPNEHISSPDRGPSPVLFALGGLALMAAAGVGVVYVRRRSSQ